MRKELSEEADPVAAMRHDSAMLADAEQGIAGIRLYRWTRLCVTLGRNQSPAEVLVDPANTAWAHRPTGGGAVLHGHDVTLSLAVPRRSVEGVRQLYRLLARVPIELLLRCGCFTSLAEDCVVARPTDPSTPYCFGSTSKYDIVDSVGRKVCGCALRVVRGAALLQTSVPVEASSVDPPSVVRGAVAQDVFVAGLNEIAASTLDAWRCLGEVGLWTPSAQAEYPK